MRSATRSQLLLGAFAGLIVLAIAGGMWLLYGGGGLCGLNQEEGRNWGFGSSSPGN